MKRYGGSGGIDPRILKSGTNGKRMGSFGPWSHYLRSKIFHYSSKRMLTGTQSRSESGDEETSLYGEETSWCVRHTSWCARHTSWCARHKYNPNSKVVESTVGFLRQCKFLQLVCLILFIFLQIICCY